MSHYALQRADGGISLLTLVEDADLDAEIEQWKTTAPPAWLPVIATEIDPAQLPADRTFRNAWRLAASAITIDMPAAREVVRERLRMARAPVLEQLDVEMLRVTTEGKGAGSPEGRAITARKQALRDITSAPEIAGAASPAALIGVQATLLASIAA